MCVFKLIHLKGEIHCRYLRILGLSGTRDKAIVDPLFPMSLFSVPFFVKRGLKSEKANPKENNLLLVLCSLYYRPFL